MARQVVIAAKQAPTAILGEAGTIRRSRGRYSQGFFRLNVSSSCVRWIGWEPDEHILRVQFVNGGLYDYFDVSPFSVETMAKAGSVGRAFWQHVRDRYAYVRIG